MASRTSSPQASVTTILESKKQPADSMHVSHDRSTQKLTTIPFRHIVNRGRDEDDQELLPSRDATSALIPVTATHPMMITVTAIRTSLAIPMMAGLMVSVWMWLMAPE
ncbi:hypothetical protein VM1G_08849 [Cytospora mali]|uniref:Uncharacterized protein n=1 Tax=Cytospora mali TaxID=578113 RepID=A0A194WB42_CYTMA|nr:hypothetical protein VM1G_08849 [Valsa mali]